MYSDEEEEDYTERLQALPSPLSTHLNASRLPHMSVNASWEDFADPEKHTSSQVGAALYTRLASPRCRPPRLRGLGVEQH